MRRPIACALAIAASLGVLGFVGRLASPRRNAAEVLGAFRPGFGRLQGIAYAPPGTRPTAAVDLGAVRDILRGGEDDRLDAELPAEAMHESALLMLGAGKPQAAIPVLERVAASPRSLNDLAVAYLARESVSRSGSDLVRALSAVEKAALLSPDGIEIAFNRALILTRLELRLSAQSAWDRYLALDSRSPWANEARAFRQSLARPTLAEAWEIEKPTLLAAAARGDLAPIGPSVERYCQFVRAWIQEEGLVAWGRAVLAADDEAVATIETRLALTARAVERVSGDPLLRQAVEALGSSRGSGRVDLARAHLAYAEGRRLYESGSRRDSERSFVEAEALMNRAGTPFRFWATFHRLLTAYHRRQGYAGLLTRVQTFRVRVARRGYGLLTARSYWFDAAVQADQGRSAMALPRVLQARALFDRLGETNYRAWMACQLALNRRKLGQMDEAWTENVTSIRDAARNGFTARLPYFIAEASDTAQVAGMPWAGLAFETEGLRLAAASGDDVDIAEALWELAGHQHAVGADEQARQSLRAALGHVERIPDRATAEHVRASVLIKKAEVDSHGDPSGALDALTEAAAVYGREDMRYLDASLALQSARVSLAGGDREAARAKALRAVGTFESERLQVEDGNDQVRFFDQARQAFDLLIELSSGSPEDSGTAAAFALAERGKAVRLRRALAPQSPVAAPLGAAEVARRLPEQTCLLEFSVLERVTIAWLLRAGRVYQVSLPVGAADLARAVDALRADIAAGQERRVARGARALARALLAPMADLLPDDGTLVIVPDQALHGLAFPMLAAAGDARDDEAPSLSPFLSIVIAPSAAVYLQLLDRARLGGGHWPPSALAVGQSVVDRELYPSLPPLGGARIEAERWAAAFPGSALLLDRDVTPARLRRELPRHEVILFAGHAVTDFHDPQRSRLLLSSGGEQGDEAALTAAEIAGLDLGEVRLVVLSACETAGGRASELEGVTSLADSFLRAGASAVLATLWPVPDDGAAAFLSSFTSAYARHGDAAAALTEARRETRQQGIHGARVWAAYSLIGASLPPTAFQGGTS